METSLVVTTKKAKAIRPPLKKSEIIEALARREYNKRMEEYRENQVLKVELTQKLEAAARAIVDARPAPKIGGSTMYYLTHDDETRLNYTFFCTNPEVYFKDFTPQMRTMARRLRELARAGNNEPDFHTIKRAIRDRMQGTTTGPSDRINALLNDPATVKALDRTLTELSKPTQPQLTAAAA